ncbi:hypothetical protein NC653_039548 [Populus alba x Populus x berolinensis]|uniref:Uncharacterized protein n=1 Tax=Populus alba x Populus x berolinensis TaxID=444605 RepID=A0AAD6LBI9_9ROSI|nr:hypothetical protein NC653_039548 [Populus alba x Populus x berolinensis]
MARLNLFYLFVTLLLSISLRPCYGLPEKTTSALFIFGDSTADPGNNNYINTTAGMRADWKPYGQNGFFEAPTGRFSDGRVFVDFIAEYAKLPIIPPFYQPSADLTNGVNFASGGAGVLPQTNQGLVVDLQTQLRSFEEVQKSLTEKLGEAEAKALLSEAVYFISVGSNDYAAGYLGNPKMQEYFMPEVYVGMVIGNLTNAIQVLYEKGARKFGFLSMSPLGCMPPMRARNPKSSEGGCFEAASDLALTHNNALNAVLTSLEQLLKGFKPYGDVYSCGGKRMPVEFQLCDNVDHYIWWDSGHPTERIHEQIAKTLWKDGPSVGPYKLEDLFFDKERLTIADILDAPDEEYFQH